jgi:ABC-type glycerol-3-phosphate transport system permease component
VLLTSGEGTDGRRRSSRSSSAKAGRTGPPVAAGSTLFLLPILVFTVLLLKHLLRGITFGALRK